MKKKVTIVVVPRERFSFAIESLDSLIENTDGPLEVVYVDGNSPHKIAEALSERCKQMGFRYVRVPQYLTPNEARNVGMQHVDSDYVVYADNDVLFRPGWLKALVECADETGAWVVAPLYLERHHNRELIHMADGKIRIEGEAPDRIMKVEMVDHKELYQEGSHDYTRKVSDVPEFHVVLFRTEGIRQMGGFDEKLQCTREHLDVALTLRDLGGEVVFEPKSVVSYVIPQKITFSDLKYQLFRWQVPKALSDSHHFSQKWGAKFEKHRPKIMRKRRRRAIQATLPRGVSKCLRRMGIFR